ncbi:RidA family protein [Paraconexibacter antarcticus]|uniref:RidA family protein n=1 Tax=Paraconexibacter antarcticus TaxID=2949664 RepID=A0ABY5DU79_9ACTN|nr:RidA family protein [Paraconexibacter antarcticus]UTI64843.1 RidA family protein [Paraconexibacter antarcticus]
MGDVERHGSGGAWEAQVGYSRVVRAGAHVWVAGCTASGEDGVVLGLGDAEAQAHAAIDAIERALATVGGALADVVRTRVFVTDIDRWQDVGRAHGARFGDIRPVTTMVEVSRLIDPRLLVEIEADAFLAGG